MRSKIKNNVLEIKVPYSRQLQAVKNLYKMGEIAAIHSVSDDEDDVKYSLVYTERFGILPVPFEVIEEFFRFVNQEEFYNFSNSVHFILISKKRFKDVSMKFSESKKYIMLLFELNIDKTKIEESMREDENHDIFYIMMDEKLLLETSENLVRDGHNDLALKLRIEGEI